MRDEGGAALQRTGRFETNLQPVGRLEIHLETTGPQERRATFVAHGPRGRELRDCLQTRVAET